MVLMVKERCYITAGDKFGPEKGKTFVIVQALYGLASSGAAYRALFEYYEYVLVYVDDILMISAEAEALGEALMREVKFKNDQVAPPEIYLGAKLEPMSLNGYDCWSMGSTDYIKAAVANVEEKLAKEGKKLPSKAYTPMSGKNSYSPELDDSDYLEGEELTYFQELIGTLRWAIEIGRVDIYHEVSIVPVPSRSEGRSHG